MSNGESVMRPVAFFAFIRSSTSGYYCPGLVVGRLVGTDFCHRDMHEPDISFLLVLATSPRSRFKPSYSLPVAEPEVIWFWE